MTADTKTIDVYRQRVADYREMTASTEDFRNLDKFIEMLPAGGKVLDIGAGPGHDAKLMTKAGLNVVALEPTPEFADLIEKEGIVVQRKTFAEIVEVECYDGAWASFSLLHATREEMPAYLKKIAKALKDEGLFVLGMKTGEGQRRDKLGRFYTYYSVDDLVSLLQDAGFKTCSINQGSAMGLAGDKDPYVVIEATKSPKVQ